MALNVNKALKSAVDSLEDPIKVVSEKTGIPERTWYRAFKDGNSVKVEFITALYDRYGIEPNQILTEKNDSVDKEEFAEVRFLPNIKASAGGGLIVENEETLPILFRRYFINSTLQTTPSNLFAMKATGDSMEPDIRDGDLLIVDESRKYIRAERPYVISIEGQVRVKLLFKVGKEKIRLVSKNKGYDPEEVSVRDCQVHGEVRHIQRTLT